MISEKEFDEILENALSELNIKEQCTLIYYTLFIKRKRNIFINLLLQGDSGKKAFYEIKNE